MLAAAQAPTPYELALAALLVVSVGALAYLFKKYNDLARQVIEEKLLVLNFLVPVLEEVLPLLPDKYKGEAIIILRVLKEMKAINEALRAHTPLKWYGLWRRYKVRLEAMLQ
jgi:hypothetical protein